MKINVAPRPQPTRAAEQTQQPEQPKDPWHQQAAEYLENSNDSFTPTLATAGMAAKFAMFGNQVTESLHPVAKVVGIVGGGLLGAYIGHTGGGVLQDANAWVVDKVFGDDPSLAKSLASTGLNTAAFGLVGGWTGAALHGLGTVAGAAHLARQDIINQG